MIPTPIIPTIMPMIMVRPSLLSKPSDIMRMPQPGGKFVMGMGSAIDIAKTNENVPIIFSQVFTLSWSFGVSNELQFS